MMARFFIWFRANAPTKSGVFVALNFRSEERTWKMTS
jgi:hypothetical protein